MSQARSEETWSFASTGMPNGSYVSSGLPLAFTVEECRRIVALGEGALEPVPGYGGGHDPLNRNACMKRIQRRPHTSWLFDRIARAAAAVNPRVWRLDLSGIHPELNLIRYLEGEFQNWHRDGVHGLSKHRKLTASVQLCAPDSFGGGRLQFFDDPSPTRVTDDHLQPGRILFFPGYEMHRVTPVTRGVRWTLVAWFEGPPLR